VRKPRFEQFLRRSINLLAKEVPVAHDRIARILGDRIIQIEVDQERVAILCDRGTIRVVSGAIKAAAQAQASRQVLVDLLEGVTTLDEAILSDRVLLRGSLDDLAALYEALMAYFRGGVDSPLFPGLLGEYLDDLEAT
jgi:hypothetical protein